MLIGAHVSVSGGYLKALEYATSVGCECIQMFAKSPRQWFGSEIDPVKAEEFVEARTSAGMPLFTHTAYLINLATPDDAMWDKSVKALADEIKRGDLLGADGVVTHMGASKGSSVEEAAKRVAAGIVLAYEASGVDGGTQLLLENSAGAGSTFGRSVEDIIGVVELLPPEVKASVRVCVDTCHAHASGVPVDSFEAWGDLLSQLDEACGPGLITAVHANDSMGDFGSHKDRHAWIGEGTLSEAAFQGMFSTSGLDGACAILEMPGEVPVKDSENISRLKRLRKLAEDTA